MERRAVATEFPQLSPKQPHYLADIRLNQDGHVAEWDSGAATLFGYSRREAVGESFYRFLWLPDLPSGALEWQLNNAYYTGHASTRGRFVRSDRAQFSAACEITPIWDNGFQG